MSDHGSKDRRHKEASLSDVTDVVKGMPKKFKEGLVPAPEHCLTVVFKRGGGIDLKFDTENTRDIWAGACVYVVYSSCELNVLRSKSCRMQAALECSNVHGHAAILTSSFLLPRKETLIKIVKQVRESQ